MTRQKFSHFLDTIDKNGVWSFGIELVKMYFSDTPNRTLIMALKRHCDSGLIVAICRGYYANPRARSFPSIPLYALPSLLRSNEQFYLSLETALSDYGLISQMPNRLVFMTTGRSQVFTTPYGIIEFVHSARNVSQFYTDCTFDKRFGFYVAEPKKAIRDAKRTNRSRDLINLEEYRNG